MMVTWKWAWRRAAVMGRPKLPEAFGGGRGPVSGGYKGEGEGMRTPNIATLWMLGILWAVLRAVYIYVWT